jgi:hypothetical protein
MSSSQTCFSIASPADVELAAQAMAHGAAVGQAIGDSYAVTTRPLMPRLFDWSQVPTVSSRGSCWRVRVGGS